MKRKRDLRRTVHSPWYTMRLKLAYMQFTAWVFSTFNDIVPAGTLLKASTANAWLIDYLQYLYNRSMPFSFASHAVLSVQRMHPHLHRRLKDPRLGPQLSPGKRRLKSL